MLTMLRRRWSVCRRADSVEQSVGGGKEGPTNRGRCPGGRLAGLNRPADLPLVLKQRSHPFSCVLRGLEGGRPGVLKAVGVDRFKTPGHLPGATFVDTNADEFPVAGAYRPEAGALVSADGCLSHLPASIRWALPAVQRGKRRRARPGDGRRGLGPCAPLGDIR